MLERQTQIAGEPAARLRAGLELPADREMLTLTTGTCFIMWLGEQITERGIGNGMSLIIFAGIVVGFPRRREIYLNVMRTRQSAPLQLILHPGDDGGGGRL